MSTKDRQQLAKTIDESIAGLDQLLDRLHRDYGISPAPVWPIEPEAGSSQTGRRSRTPALARKVGKKKRATQRHGPSEPKSA